MSSRVIGLLVLLVVAFTSLGCTHNTVQNPSGPTTIKNDKSVEANVTANLKLPLAH